MMLWKLHTAQLTILALVAIYLESLTYFPHENFAKHFY